MNPSHSTLLEKSELVTEKSVTNLQNPELKLFLLNDRNFITNSSLICDKNNLLSVTNLAGQLEGRCVGGVGWY